MSTVSNRPRHAEISLGLDESPFLYEVLEQEGSFEWEAPSTFVPVPVENPGGGRVTVKKDPAKHDVVEVKGAFGRIVPLHRLAAEALGAMQAAAWQAGIKKTVLLPTSGYRSTAKQERLFKQAVQRYGSEKEARKWVAKPGGSAHHSGRAIDLYLGVKNGSGYVKQQRATAAYRWLVDNAVKFGFYPYEREPWHWEYNPPANGKVVAPTPVLPPPETPLAPPLPSAPVSGDTPQLIRSESTVGPGKTLYVKVNLKVPENDPWTGIFVPEGFRLGSRVDVILYLHGFYESRVDRYWIRERKQPLPLREGLHESRKNAVLVVPTLGPKSQPGSLIKAGQLDAYLAQVFKALGVHALNSPAPSLGNLVLAAHSGGGKYMAALALGKDAALASLRECWAFDSFYGASAISQWAEWARKNPDKQLISHAATDLKQTETKKVPGPLTVSKLLKAKRLPNVQLNTASDGHYGAVRAHWVERLSAASFFAQR